MGPVGRLGLLVAVALATSLGLAARCRAGGLVIELPTLMNVAPGSSGSFDVLLLDTDPAGTMGYNVAEDNLELTLELVEHGGDCSVADLRQNARDTVEQVDVPLRT